MSNTLLEDNEKEVKSYRELLVGEGRKFKDDEEMAKGKYFADADIALKNKLLDEQRELILQQRDEINKIKSLEELVDQINQRDLTNSKNTQAKEVSTKPMLDPAELDSLLSKKLQTYELQKKEEANLASVRVKLKEQYGEKATEVLKHKMEELSLSEEDLNNLAKKSPNAFYNSLGMNQTARESFQAPPRSEVRNDSFKPNVDRHTWSWYKTKYKNRDFITNKDINVQMAKDAAELGDAFYDGDFYNSYHKPS